MSTASADSYMEAMVRSFRSQNAGGLRVTYHLNLTDSGGGDWTIAIDNGRCTINRGRPAKSDTSISMNTGNYLKLAAGKLDVRSAYGKGEIKISGSTNHALALTSLFSPWADLVTNPPPPEPVVAPPVTPQPPPIPPAPVTPPAPDPKPAPVEPGLAQYVAAMPSGLRRDKAGGVKATYQFQLSGNDGGTWSVTIANQSATVYQGGAGPATVTIEMSGESFKKLAQGKLNTTQAYRSKEIKVRGDVNLAARLSDLFAPWADKAATASAPAPAPTPAPSPPAQPAPSPAPGPVESPAAGSVYPQLMNGSFDEFQPYIRDGEAKDWNEFPERFGKYWNFAVISEARRRVRLMDSATFGKFTQKYFGGGGNDYHIHGKHSQVITGRFGFDVVMYQSVATRPGQSYTFSGSIVSFYKGTAGARKDGAIIKTIGVDPTGGQNWQSSSVIWGENDGKDNEWRYPSLQVKAQAESMTVFVRIDNKEDDVGMTELNIIHLENFKLE